MNTKRLNKLLNDLTHKDSSRRRSAAEALSEGDERALYPLIKSLQDENLGVQDATIQSLIRMKQESTAYMLLPLLRESSFLRNTAMLILREMGKIAVPLFRSLLTDKDDDIRKFALDLIYDVEYCDYPEDLAYMLSNDSNSNVRAAAAKALGTLQYRKAIPQLIQSLNDEEWVCFSALEALAKFKDDKSLEHIIALLDSPSETIRFAVIETLGKIRSSKATNRLTECELKADDFERKLIIKSLVQIGTISSTPQIVKTLIEMLEEDDWEDTYIAIKGLSTVKANEAIYQIIDLAGSMEPSVPENEDKIEFIKKAVYSIGCHENLINIIDSPTMKFRGKTIAIEILGDLQCTDTVHAIINALKSDYRDVRRASIEALIKFESDEVSICLMDSINHLDSHVRKIAIMALGKIGAVSAFEPLIATLDKEEFSDIKDSIIVSLLEINSTLFLSRIDEFNDDIRNRIEHHTADSGPGVTC